MRRRLNILVAVAAILAPSVSLANDDLLSGLWRVSGRVATFGFSETCRLERHGDQLAGACLEGSGKTHPLTTFDVVYSAVLHDGEMDGELSAAGHEGAFKAARI